MDIFKIIQIIGVIILIGVPVGTIWFVLWVKQLIDEGRKIAKLELEIMAKQGSVYGNCSACGEQIQKGFQFCPTCHKKLANRCRQCRRFLDVSWTMCPFCGEDYGKDSAPPEKKT